MLEAFSSQATVLGKRKAKQSSDKLVLHLTSPSLTSTKLSSGPGSAILVNGSLIANTAKRYRCTQHGCEKSYSKPSRLEEHERSHTGQVNLFLSTHADFHLRDRITFRDHMFAKLAVSPTCGKLTFMPIPVHISRTI